MNADAGSSVTLNAEPGDSSNMATNKIMMVNEASALLNLPNEIKDKIWALAVKVDEPIIPVQLRTRSNKFVWSKSQVNLDSSITVSAAPPLTAVQLSQVCRQVYDEVAGGQVFYKVNHFKFPEVTNRSEPPPAINYLIAITPARMRAIRSMSCDWKAMRFTDLLFTVLAACDKLQNLELHMDWQFGCPHPSVKLRDPTLLLGFRELSIAVQGLTKLKITATSPRNHPRQTLVADSTKKLCELVKSLLTEEMNKPKPSAIKYSLKKFRKAQEISELDVFGEGRLGQDKKPGIISSRTRQKVRHLEKLALDGTLPRLAGSKYDIDGEMLWFPIEIFDSREAITDDGTPSVEFHLKCEPWRKSGLPIETSWEDLATLTTFWWRDEINGFYVNHPEAFGKEIVAEAWIVYGSSDSCRKFIKAMIVAEQKIESKRAAQKARVAASLKRKAEREKSSKSKKRKCGKSKTRGQ